MLRFIFVFLVLLVVDVTPQNFHILPDLVHVIRSKGNVRCETHSKMFVENLKNMTAWAYEMWEASATSSSGTLEGNAYQLGDFDQCLKAEAPFRTQYCLVELHLEIPANQNQPVPFSNQSVINKLRYSGDPTHFPRNVVNIGLCIPNSCSHRDLEKSLNEELRKPKYKNDYNVSYSVSVALNRCQNDRSDEDFTFGDISFCLLIATLIVIAIFSTVYDNAQMNDYKKKDSTFDQVIQCFSLRKNFSDLNQINDSDGALKILYGLRTLCICMIIIDHRIANFVSGPISNKAYVEQASQNLATKIVVFNGDLYVDSFFVLSGLLVIYTMLSILEKRSISPWIIILGRYIRLTPVYGIIVFFFATVFLKTGSGPLWKVMVEPEVLDCQKNWWTSILYLGNYVNVENMCIIYSWYLPCDFHFLIIAIFLTMLIKKNKIVGLLILSIIFVVSILIPAAITIFYQLPALLYFQTQAPTIPISKTDFHFNSLYITSHCRASPFFIGMFTGYTYYKLRKSTFRIPALVSHFLTGVGLALMIGTMCFGLPFYDPQRRYDVWEAAAYASLHRPAWALGTAILLLNASYGKFGIMRSVLSWHPWVPLSKLVYGAYLTHLCFQLRSVATVKSSQFLDPVVVGQEAIQDLAASFFCALILNLCVETPCRKLLNVLVASRQRTNSQEDRESV